MKTAEELSAIARQSSKLANLWLEHPAKAHADHEAAASAHENAGNKSRAAEHRRAAQYWAAKELDWNNKRYATRRN